MPLGLRQFWLARSCWLPICDIPWAKNWRQKQSQSTILYLRKFSWGSMFPKPPRLLLLIIINSSNMHLTCFLSCKLDTLILAFVSYCCIHCSKAKKVYKKKICMRYVHSSAIDDSPVTLHQDSSWALLKFSTFSSHCGLVRWRWRYIGYSYDRCIQLDNLHLRWLYAQRSWIWPKTFRLSG